MSEMDWWFLTGNLLIVCITVVNCFKEWAGMRRALGEKE